MGPCHSCDYVDIFMGELDEKLVEKMDEENIPHTGFKIFRDDSWDILLNADEDLPKYEDILDSLHPSIKWTLNVGDSDNFHALEFLDLTIMIIDGKIETDLFAKDVPIFLPKNSCHPPHVFTSIVKSVGYRLNVNCSIDKFLDNRKTEYSCYLYASIYPPKMVKKILDQTTGLTKNEKGDFVHGEARKNREGLINCPRKDKKKPGKRVFPFVTQWDPRKPDIRRAIENASETLYLDPINEKLFPKGSIITGFRRGKNLGEIICPTNPVRVPPPPPPLPQRKCGCATPPGKGCRPCSHKICQIHKNLAVTEKEQIISYYDNRPIQVKKNLDCCTPNLVYLLQCTEHQKQYCGSAVGFKSRWSKHKTDMISCKDEDCGFCKHWAKEHKNSPQDLSPIKIIFLDQIDDPGAREEDFPKLKALEGKWMANLGCLASMSRNHGLNVRDDAKPKQQWKN